MIKLLLTLLTGLVVLTTAAPQECFLESEYMAGERPSYFKANFSDLEVLTSDIIQADMRLESVFYCTDSRERSNK